MHIENKVITTMVSRALDDRKYIVLDLRSLIWGFDESCTIFHGINSPPTNQCVLKCALLIFPSVQLAEI